VGLLFWRSEVLSFRVSAVSQDIRRPIVANDRRNKRTSGDKPFRR